MKAERIVLFADDAARDLGPLVALRPPWDLRCGATTLVEKVRRAAPNGVPVLTRAEGKAPTLFLNGRAIWRELPPLEGPAEAAFSEGTLAWVRAEASDWRAAGADASAREAEVVLLRYPWDVIEACAGEIVADAAAVAQPIHPTARIDKGAVLDDSEGPILVGENARVRANAVVEGPAAIGAGSEVGAGAWIRPGSAIGPVCKVGGEVSCSIFQGYSNKAHHGFLGHTFVGEWVNLGAGTTTSNLKNDYGSVKSPVRGRRVDSGRTFFGAAIGDHVKTGIGTTLVTGTIVGPCSNLFGAGFPPQWIPAFSWGGADGLVEHRLEKAIETARRMMRRRGRDLSAEEERAIRELFEITRADREAAGVHPA